jgi:hypothetical protein
LLYDSAAGIKIPTVYPSASFSIRSKRLGIPLRSSKEKLPA